MTRAAAHRLDFHDDGLTIPPYPRRRRRDDADAARGISVAVAIGVALWVGLVFAVALL